MSVSGFLTIFGINNDMGGAEKTKYTKRAFLVLFEDLQFFLGLASTYACGCDCVMLYLLSI